MKNVFLEKERDKLAVRNQVFVMYLPDDVKMDQEELNIQIKIGLCG